MPFLNLAFELEFFRVVNEPVCFLSRSDLLEFNADFYKVVKFATFFNGAMARPKRLGFIA